MKITDVKTVLLTGPSGNDPWLQPLRKRRSAAFVEIYTDTDLIGIGETYTGYHAPEIVPAIVDFFKPILVGLTDEEIDPRMLWERMYYCANFWARSGVGVNILAGIEGALWDLKGKMENLPVHRLLGGPVHDRLPGYATGCASLYPWSELLAKFEAYREAGFNAAKVGAGWYNMDSGEVFMSRTAEEWAEMEREKLEAVREGVGEDFTVCLDGHMSNTETEGLEAWDVATAKHVLQAVEPYNLLFFEEPLHYNDRAGYAEVCRNTSVKVAGGEGLFTREEFELYAQDDAFDLAQPDASYIGISAFLDVARMFQARDRNVATHAWSSGVGVMENIHAAFATENIAILELPPLAGPMHTELYADGYRFEDGFILPPEAPGLGVTLTEEFKNRYPFVPNSGEWNPVPGKPQRD